MSNYILHKANTRGEANHGWLHAKHTFSFANYQNRERMHFGALRVLNDDCIDAGMGFGMHPHDNMEIITIPLEGVIEHKDSMGNIGTITAGEIQVMSAGTGIQHSEYNGSAIEQLKLLQIWLFPKVKNVTPRYAQMSIDTLSTPNILQQILSPNANDAGVWIHQDAWFHLGKLTADFSVDYTLKKQGNGIYVFVISGNVLVQDQPLEPRDGIGMWNETTIKITASTAAKILIMEVPEI